MLDAYNAALAGDVIQVGDGTYYELITITKAVTIEAKAGTSPIITGAIQELVDDPSGKWTFHATTGGFDVYRYPYTGNPNSITVARNDGTRLWTYGSLANLTSQHAGEGVFLDTAADRLYVILDGNADPNGVPLRVSRDNHTIFLSNVSNVTLRGLGIELAGESPVLIRNQCHNNTVTDCAIKYGFNGIWLKPWNAADFCNNNIIENCTIEDNYETAWTWEDVKDFTPKHMETTGIRQGAGGTGNIFRGNTVTKYFNGIVLNKASAAAPNIDGTLVHDNTVHDIRDDAIEVENYASNLEIFSNLIYDAYVGFSFTPFPRGPVYFYRNRVITDKTGANNSLGRSTKRSATDTVAKVKIYHNTFYSHGDCMQMNNSDPALMTEFEFYNNIWYTEGGATGRGANGSPIHVYNGNECDYNLWFRDDTTAGNLFRNFNINDTTTRATLAAFLASPEQINSRSTPGDVTTGWEGNSIEDDPEFTDLVTYPYPLEIAVTSPAIGAGRTLPASFPDRTQYAGSTDIGAIPFSAGGGGGVSPVYKNDANLKALYLLENDTNDYLGVNNLTNNGVTFNSSDFQEGAYSGDFEKGSSQYAAIADGSQTGLDLDSVSIVAWIKLESVGAIHTIVSKDDNNTQRSYELHISAANLINIRLSNTGSANTNYTANTALSSATWYHVAAVYNKTDVRLYLDGVLDNTPTARTSTTFNGTAEFALGRRSAAAATNYFDGLMDEVGIFDRALSADEVEDIYLNGIRDAGYPVQAKGVTVPGLRQWQPAMMRR